MRLVDILTSPWAIVPEKLAEIQAIYQTHIRGEKIDLTALEAKLGQPLANEPKPYEVVSGVALIEMEGIVAKRMSLFTKISGGVSTHYVQQQFAAAMTDRKVRAILLNIDSPGGGVDGTAELAEMIHSARGEKPIVAWTDGMMTSAAYWIGSAADAVFTSGGVTQIGSIGVVASHMDISEAEKKIGIKTTEIVAGKYKRVGSRHSPLSKEDRETIQERVDYVYSVFVDDVAKHRGISSEEVLERMADGRIFLGRRAVEAGLVDGVSTMEELIGKLSAGEITSARPPAAGAVAVGEATRLLTGLPAGRSEAIPAEEERDVVLAVIGDVTAGKIMEVEKMPKIKIGTKEVEAQEGITIDAKYISENCPDIAGALRGEGAQAERERVQGIEEAALPGHEGIVAEAKKDGKSTGADVALQIVKAENKIRTDKLAEIRGDAPKPVPAVAVDGILPEAEKKEKGFMALVDEHQATNKCSRGDAIRAVAQANPKAHEKYVAQQQVGASR